MSSHLSFFQRIPLLITYLYDNRMFSLQFVHSKNCRVFAWYCLACCASLNVILALAPFSPPPTPDQYLRVSGHTPLAFGSKPSHAKVHICWAVISSISNTSPILLFAGYPIRRPGESMPVIRKFKFLLDGGTWKAIKDQLNFFRLHLLFLYVICSFHC